MKLQPLLEGKWIVKNLDGKEKRFSDYDSPEAQAWRTSHTKKSEPGLGTKAWQKLYYHEPKKPKKPTLDEIYSKVEMAVGESFPDGDPLDRLGRWMREHDLTMDDIDRAFKKNAKQTYHQYLGDMWEGMAQDAFHDAYTQYHKHGEVDDDYGPYWYMSKEGPKLRDNPWLTRAEQEKARKDMAGRY